MTVRKFPDVYTRKIKGFEVRVVLLFGENRFERVMVWKWAAVKCLINEVCTRAKFSRKLHSHFCTWNYFSLEFVKNFLNVVCDIMKGY